MNTQQILFLTGLTLSVVAGAFGQTTNLQFLNTGLTVERVPILFWQSQPNAIYRIEYSSALVSSNTVWQTLYDEYPSHGTNSFIADAGNYDMTPEVRHPKFSTARFYRVALVGTNTSLTNPIVSIASPTNGGTLSG